MGYLVPQRVKNSSLLRVLPHATYTQVKVVLGIFSPADNQNSSPRSSAIRHLHSGKGCVGDI